ncbi:MAG: class I SAM-dependent methyltransferase, partial [Pseudomonadota bacterium]
LIKAAGKCGYYAGVELFADAARQSEDRIDTVLVGDAATVPLDFPDGHFDALILSEVLEHLADPWAVLRRVAPLIKRGGIVLASSPNVAHWRVLRTIASGDFRHEASGVFDRTHLRWFTPKTFAKLFENTGFAIETLGPVTPFAARTRAMSKLTGGRLDYLFMTQIMIAGRKV